jgi:hypothetical protein
VADQRGDGKVLPKVVSLNIIKAMLTKREAREILCELEVIKFCVLSTPDWEGGCEPDIRIQTTQFNAIPEELADFQYCLFIGDATEVIRNLNKEVGEFRDRDSYREGEPDYYITLRDAVLDCASKYLH